MVQLLENLVTRGPHELHWVAQLLEEKNNFTCLTCMKKSRVAQGQLLLWQESINVMLSLLYHKSRSLTKIQKPGKKLDLRTSRELVRGTAKANNIHHLHIEHLFADKTLHGQV